MLSEIIVTIVTFLILSFVIIFLVVYTSKTLTTNVESTPSTVSVASTESTLSTQNNKEKLDKYHTNFVNMKTSTFMFRSVGVYYINLNRCTYRKKFMEYMFDDLGIKNFHRIEAVDGIQGVLKENVKCNLSLENVSPNIVATTISHLKTIRTAYKNKEKYALILEDDVSLFMSKIWQKDLKLMIDNLPYDWEIFVLSSRILENSFGDLYKLKKKENI